MSSAVEDEDELSLELLSCGRFPSSAVQDNNKHQNNITSDKTTMTRVRVRVRVKVRIRVGVRFRVRVGDKTAMTRQRCRHEMTMTRQRYL